MSDPIENSNNFHSPNLSAEVQMAGSQNPQILGDHDEIISTHVDQSKFTKSNKLPIFLIAIAFLFVLVAVYFLWVRPSDKDDSDGISGQSQQITTPSATPVTSVDGSAQLMDRLMTHDYGTDQSNPIWVEAFGPWTETTLADNFSLLLPNCSGIKDCEFNRSETAETSDYFYGKEKNCEKLGSGYFVSSYYEPIYQLVLKDSSVPRNDIYLAGALDICKIITPTDLSAQEFVNYYNNKIKGECTLKKEEGYSLQEGKSQLLSLNNPDLKVVSFVSDTCSPEGGAPGPIERYIAQYKENLYIFSGGQEPLPVAVMTKIFDSIK